MSQRRAAASASGLANQLNDAISRLDTRLSNLAQRRKLRPSRCRHTTRWCARPDIAAALSHLATAQPGRSRCSDRRNLGTAPLAERWRRLRSCAKPVHAACAAARACPAAGACRHRPVRHRASAPQPDQPDGGAAPPRSSGSVDRRLSRGTCRNPPLADRGAAAPGDSNSLENEIRTLGQKIERSRESGGDQETLGGIERALNEIYGAVRTLTPAEQLTGYDTRDPESLRQDRSAGPRQSGFQHRPAARGRDRRAAQHRRQRRLERRDRAFERAHPRARRKARSSARRPAATTCWRRWSSASHC